MQREDQIRRYRLPLLRPYLHLALPSAMLSNMVHREGNDNACSETLAERLAFLLRKGKTAAISGSGPGIGITKMNYRLTDS
jgi:hypothetical protein